MSNNSNGSASSHVVGVICAVVSGLLILFIEYKTGMFVHDKPEEVVAQKLDKADIQKQEKPVAQKPETEFNSGRNALSWQSIEFKPTIPTVLGLLFLALHFLAFFLGLFTVLTAKRQNNRYNWRPGMNYYDFTGTRTGISGLIIMWTSIIFWLLDLSIWMLCWKNVIDYKYEGFETLSMILFPAFFIAFGLIVSLAGFFRETNGWRHVD